MHFQNGIYWKQSLHAKEERSLSYEHSRFYQFTILHEKVHYTILLPGRTDPCGYLPWHPGRVHSCIYHASTEPVHGLADTEPEEEIASTPRTILDGILCQGKRVQGQGVVLSLYFSFYFSYIFPCIFSCIFPKRLHFQTLESHQHGFASTGAGFSIAIFDFFLQILTIFLYPLYSSRTIR